MIYEYMYIDYITVLLEMADQSDPSDFKNNMILTFRWRVVGKGRPWGFLYMEDPHMDGL